MLETRSAPQLIGNSRALLISGGPYFLFMETVTICLILIWSAPQWLLMRQFPVENKIWMINSVTLIYTELFLGFAGHSSSSHADLHPGFCHCLSDPNSTIVWSKDCFIPSYAFSCCLLSRIDLQKFQLQLKGIGVSVSNCGSTEREVYHFLTLNLKGISTALLAFMRVIN